MAEYSDSAVVTIDNIDLDDVLNDIEFGGDAPSKPIKTLNKRKKVKGFKHSMTEHSATLSAEPLVDSRVPDWFEMRDTKKRFQIFFTPNKGGKKVQLKDCYVTSVRRGASDGDGAFKIGINYTDQV